MSGIIWLAVLAVFLLLPLLGMAPMAWRILRHNEEMEPGSSIGREVFRRRKGSDRANG